MSFVSLKNLLRRRASAPEALLERAPLQGDLPLPGGSYAGARVLISGAGGTIGTELCRQLLRQRPAALILFELSELALYTVEAEIRQAAAQAGVALVPVLGSVADPALVARVFADHAVDVVFHAAAYKHVPLVEDNPLAGVGNNALGTDTLARAAQEAGVARFVLISSDKAVRPRSVMGASKRLAELIVQDRQARDTKTAFNIVRFGNVLGSSGSVLHRFRDQIARGGPVTVTDPQATRYFMTVEEAVRLVLLSGTLSGDGAVFVLDMGRPVRILHLARRMIALAGLRPRGPGDPTGDIEIVFTGLRPGEKRHEDLSRAGRFTPTAHPGIYRVTEAALSELEVAGMLRDLRDTLDRGNTTALRAQLCHWITDYDPAPAHSQVGAQRGANAP